MREAFSQLEEASISELQAAMSVGQITARQVTEFYLERINTLDRQGPTLRSIIETNRDALDIADKLDQERAIGRIRGPLHGIPLLLKDNIATADKMQTTAGSLALLGACAPRDAFVVKKLREAGAIILGKTNLSEWANCRSTRSSSGWSARGGQTRNPYVLDRTPYGSSSGSASAVAANLAAASLGTETNGSILRPAAANSVVGIKPTVGLTSRAGVIPVSHSQDSVGSFGRSVADAAAVLGAITGSDPHDAATHRSAGRAYRDYTQMLDPNGMRGARIGIPRRIYFGYSTHADAVVNTAIECMRNLGATIIDPANIPTAQQMMQTDADFDLLLMEFKAGLNAYLAELISTPVRTLAELIAFNETHASKELMYFGQDIFLQAQEALSLDNPRYFIVQEECQRLARQRGIDAIMDTQQLDALVMPTTAPPCPIDIINGQRVSGSSSQPAALAGYPAISIPAGYVFELPVGITFTGRAFSEPTLIKLAYALEQAMQIRHPPRYLPTLCLD